jgi:hypothetical protein
MSDKKIYNTALMLVKRRTDVGRNLEIEIRTR